MDYWDLNLLEDERRWEGYLLVIGLVALIGTIQAVLTSIIGAHWVGIAAAWFLPFVVAVAAILLHDRYVRKGRSSATSND